jgi:hypothetical protein
MGQMGQHSVLIRYARACVGDYRYLRPICPMHPSRNGTMSNRLSGGPVRLPAGPMYERTNRHGDRFLVGRLGTLKIFVVPTTEISKGDKVWQLYFAEGPYSTPEQQATAARLEETRDP